MAKWQPPIPSGALWCKPMRELGPAKALIEYCYDIVDRDGWCRFKLVEVADAMDEPYINVKRWWKAVQASNEIIGIFADVKNRGVRGIELQFATKWLDWRILRSRTETGPAEIEEVSTLIPLNTDDAERSTKEVFPLIPLVIEIDPNGIKRSTNEVSTLIPLDPAYKVLIPTDQAVFADAATAAPPPPVRKPKKATHTPEQQAYLDRKKAIEVAYVKALGYKPAAFGAEAKAAKWLAEQDYTAEQVIGCLETLQQDKFYDGKHIRLQVVANQIGAWVKARSRPIVNPGANIPVIRAPENPEPRRIRTQEEIDDLYFKATGKYPKLRLPNA